MGPIDLLEFDRDFEKSVWETVLASSPSLGATERVESDTDFLLTPPICLKLAILLLARRSETTDWTVLNDGQLASIAEGVADAPSDIDEVPGVYIFVCLSDYSVLKVGQTKNLRQRVDKGHLRGCFLGTTSRVIDRFVALDAWPGALRDLGIGVLLLPLLGSDEPDRLCIENGLIRLLNPVMT